MTSRTDIIKAQEKRTKILVCGTRGTFDNYKEIVKKKLSDLYWNERGMSAQGSDFKFIIIEGCCEMSADVYAEEWVKENNQEIKHFPSTSGNYLKRNIEMVKELEKGDYVLAFWNGFSYGTAHTIATAVKRGISVLIVNLRE